MTIVTADGLKYLQLADRQPLLDIAVEANTALARGDVPAARTALERMPELGELGVTDAVLGERELTPVPWTPTPTSNPRQMIGVVTSSDGPPESLRVELKNRRVGIQLFNDQDAATMWASEFPEKILGEFVMGTDSWRDKVFGPLEAGGKHVINPYTYERNAKDVMAEQWAIHNIPTPETVTRIQNEDDAIAAYQKLGPDVVVKLPHGAHGAEVVEAHNENEAIGAVRLLLEDTAYSTRTRGVLMQRKIDTSNRDVRLHFARDWKTGELHPVGAVERRNFGEGFKTNLSGKGTVGVRPIYDFDGSDPALPSEAIEAARRAGDALGFDAFAADVAIDAATGKPAVFEVDINSQLLDSHFPVPREHSVNKHFADLLLFGDGATTSAARGASLVTQ
jgi:glutathione synthase/RimK-type ligase-like ATP-grasp enzyme